ncbi:MAG: TRAP transporter substrate-binding protein DctP [Rhodospirillaceae bacterium]|nr:TRAP transporter substrate-binding protein DctP [Rhodospirillaceae bacterium]
MRSLLSILAVVVCLTAPAHAQNALVGRVAGTVPKGSVWEAQWQHRMEVLKASPAVNFEYYIYGELGNEETVLGNLRRNRVQIASGSLWGLAALVPEVAVLSLPYLFETPEEADFVYDCCAARAVESYLSATGYQFLSWSEAGWTNFYSKSPILTPDDVKGRKLRTPSTASVSVFFRDLGIDTVFIPINDIVPSLQTGLVEGGASSLPWYFNAFRSQAPHYTLTQHHYESTVLMANADWHAKATPEQKALLSQAFGGFAEQRQLVRKDFAAKIDQMRSEGTGIHSPSTEQLARWMAAAQASHAHILREIGGNAEQVYAEILKAKAEFKARREPG